MLKKTFVAAAVLGLMLGCGGSSEPANQAPTADFTWSPANPDIGATVTFDASASDDPDGTIASYSWTFTDGTPSTGTGVGPTCSFGSAGFKTVELTVTDDKGATNSVMKQVPINDPSDTTPPDLDVTSVKLKGTATDNVQVDTITAVDGGSNDVLGATSGTGTSSATWETTDVTLGSPSTPGTGSASVTVEATDSSSNTDSITIDVTESTP